MKQTKKILYILIGTIALILGTVGLFLPLLPTTPFWLLTCWCYIHSSETLYRRVMSNRLFGGYIKDYVEGRAIAKKTKIVSLSVMWLSTILTSAFLTTELWIKIGLVCISAIVSWHIISFPSKRIAEKDKGTA